MLRKFHHACIIGTDYEKTIDFYVHILGFSVFRETYSKELDRHKIELYFNGEYLLEVFVICRAAIGERGKLATGLDHLSFLTDNVQETVAYLRSRNVKTSEIKVDQATGKEYAFFYDPDGLKLEIYNM